MSRRCSRLGEALSCLVVMSGLAAGYGVVVGCGSSVGASPESRASDDDSTAARGGEDLPPDADAGAVTAPDATDFGGPPPPEVASDPGFEEELAEIGWHPIALADGLDAVAGDGLPPSDADALGEITAAPGIGWDGLGGVVGSKLAVAKTGFFHLQRPAGAERAWLVDPMGNPFYAVGVNTVLRTSAAPDIEAYLRRLDDLDVVAKLEWDRLSAGSGGGYGYRFNSTLGFSNSNDLGPSPNPIINHAPYGVVVTIAAPDAAPFAMRDAAGAIPEGGTSLGDPYNPAYREHLRKQWVALVRPKDPMLITYYLGNEVGLFDWPQHVVGNPPGTRDMRPYIWAACPPASTIDKPLCASHALVHYLRQRHVSIAALNQAWGSSFAGFDGILAARPSPDAKGARACTGECEQDLQRFQRRLWRRWITLWTGMLRELDPNHVIASPRLAIVNPNYYCFWGIPSCVARFNDGRKVGAGSGVTYSPFRLFRRNGPYGFDLVAVNAYSKPRVRAYEEPWFRSGLHKIIGESKLPIVISEFGVRSKIDGFTNGGGAGSFVPDGTPAQQQEARGQFYRYDMSRFATFRGVVGASYHRWADRYDAEDQMNMGIVHRNGERWEGFDAHIRAWNRTVYSRLNALTGF